MLDLLGEHAVNKKTHEDKSKKKKYLQWIKFIGIIWTNEEEKKKKHKGCEKTKMAKTVGRVRERERERAGV